MNGPRIAIVHDWLPVFGGAERVLEQILAVFPTADVFTLVDLLSQQDRVFLRGKSVRTSFLQRFGWVRRNYRKFLPLMPLAITRFNLSRYDLILSSSYAVAKGVVTRPRQLHVCYCHSPMRYVWDLQEQYLREAGLDRGLRGWLARGVLSCMRRWDVRSHRRVDSFIANSQFVRQRIARAYDREATVIHPPVDVEQFTPSSSKGSHYVTASRLVSYKMIHLLVQAFNRMPDLELRVIGEGPEFERISAVAAPNVKMLGHQSAENLRSQLQGARAFVFAALEDFGIAPVEAQACGTPVIAFGQGGALETVVPGETGLFFDEQTPASVVGAVRRFEAQRESFSPETIRRHALQFRAARFRSEFAAEVEACAQKKFNRSLEDAFAPPLSAFPGAQTSAHV
jgi:glycosyltransferase involved in cell wall biosynthesis